MSFKHQIPTILTLSRVIGAPILLLPFIKDNDAVWWFTTVAFILLSLTDYFDGMLARKYNVVSNFGKYFDPAGDKVLVLFSLVLLMHFKGLSPFIIMILLTRDVLIGSIRSFGASMGLVLQARSLGKFKTVLQMIGLPILMAPKFFPLPMAYGQYRVGTLVLWLACIISVVSLIDYALVLYSSLKAVDKTA
jgi:CDP-diacylglycerol--glycerol-3-phosphate 3-phosphatidyltransferase